MILSSPNCDYQLPDRNRQISGDGNTPKSCLAYVLLLIAAISFPAIAGADPAILSILRSSALAGDLRPVNQWVSDLENNQEDVTLDELSKVLLRQYRERFLTLNESTAFTHDGDQGAIAKATDSANLLSNRLAIEAIAAYQRYWRAVLTRTVPPGQADHELQLALKQLLATQQPGPADTQASSSGDVSGMARGDVFAQLEHALAQQGLGSSAGLTPPWRDLYIWDEQDSHTFQVELTDSVEQVNVTFIEQPLVQGWQHYASLDLVSTSGWATPQGLFCLCWSYDLDSSAFQVSWLKHEARHSVDFREFPGMPEEQLEYRAKLTELAFSDEHVSSLLRQFSDSGSASGGSAHSAANYRVSQDIYREIFGEELPADRDPWQLLGPVQVAPAAVRLLQRDTEARRR